MEQFQVHCDEHSLLPFYQSAYRKDHSCETAIARIMNDLLTTMEEGRVSSMLFMDLSVVFDTVDYSVLQSVLDKTFNVKGHALSWFMSYLTLHWCKVVINQEYS